MIILTEEHRLIKNIVFRLVRNHIAGLTMNSALDTVKAINSKGLGATVTFLNEHVYEPTKARYNANTYVQAVKQMSRLNLNSSISVRLSQIGYSLGNGVFEKGLYDILEAANASSTYVWLESGTGVSNDDLIGVYRMQKEQYPNIGMEIPISYYNEFDGIVKTLKPSDSIRLTSHSYIAETKKSDEKSVEKNTLKRYVSSINILLHKSAKVRVQDSNEKLIARIASNTKEYRKKVAFEIPLGYNKKKVNKLIKSKVNIDVYVPYGKDWAPYAIYRLAGKRLRSMALAVLNGEERSDIDAYET